MDLWPTFIAGTDELNSQEYKDREIVLQYLALFKKFGYRGAVVEEAKAIHALIVKGHPHITWPRFQGIIRVLSEDRKILQGESTLYITPKLLHIYLWAEWWNTYGEGLDVDDIIVDLPPQLLQWFFDMMRYADESNAATKVIEDLLKEGGAFHENDLIKSKIGSRFFLAMSEAAPGIALKFLQNSIGQWSKGELLKFSVGRRSVIWALEKIVIWKNHFVDGARLLLNLAEAENESYSNNATGVFGDLFSLGYGKLSSTEASPSDRIVVVKEALSSSSSEEKIMVGIEALNTGLNTVSFSRGLGAEYQGLKTEPILWVPETYGDLHDAYRDYWRLLYNSLDFLSADAKKRAIEIILSNARGLLNIESLVDMILEDLDNLLANNLITEERLIEVIVTKLHYDKNRISSDSLNKIVELRNKLVGDDFSSQLKRYVGLNLIEDKFDEEGNHVDKITQKIIDLAQFGIANPEALINEFPWLINSNPQNAYGFGYELGKLDNEFELLNQIIDTQKEFAIYKNLMFFGGYLRSVNELDQDYWEGVMDKLAQDPFFIQSIAELTSRSGFSDRALLRLLNLAEKGFVEIYELSWLGMGKKLEGITENLIIQLIEFLVKHEKAGGGQILFMDVFDRYFLSKKYSDKLPAKLTFDLLTSEQFFTLNNEYSYLHTMDYFHWERVCEVYLNQYPEKSIEVAEKLLNHFGEQGTVIDISADRPRKVLNKIVQKYPFEIWSIVSSLMTDSKSIRTFHLASWLRGNEGFGNPSVGAGGVFNQFPEEKIWEWVEEDVEVRAPFIARYVPKELISDEKGNTLARELLIRFGEVEGVRDNLVSNFLTGSWMGDWSAYLSTKINELENILNNEEDEKVVSWIKYLLEILYKDFERARVEEEREY